MQTGRLQWLAERIRASLNPQPQNVEAQVEIPVQAEQQLSLADQNDQTRLIANQQQWTTIETVWKFVRLFIGSLFVAEAGFDPAELEAAEAALAAEQEEEERRQREEQQQGFF